jgi:type IV pilus assembly protein PilY1
MVVNDRFYMVRDPHLFDIPASYTKLTENDLYDATENLVGSTDQTTRETATTELLSASGWYIDLENAGEKSLAESVTVNYQILFTTVEPTSAGQNCTSGGGTGRIYVVNVLDATPTIALGGNSNDPLTKADRNTTLIRPGIPPSPTVLFAPEPVVLVGPETPLGDLSFGNLTNYTFWENRLD